MIPQLINLSSSLEIMSPFGFFLTASVITTTVLHIMSTSFPVKVDREVLLDSPEGKLFGRFFRDIAKCLELMKEKNSFSTGGTVLHAFELDPIWFPKWLGFYVDNSNSEVGACPAWESYLQDEGYAFNESKDMLDGQVSVLQERSRRP